MNSNPDARGLFQQTLMLLALIGLTAASCTTALLREDDVSSLNDRYRDLEFVTATDIQPTFSTTASDAEPEVIYPAGTRVKIWVESDQDWIRVRATPVAEKREHNPGKIIIYIFRDFLKEDGESEEVQERYPVSRLEAEIAEILTEVGG
ncbi:MAG: type II secretion system-associated lipoprotein [bacterium]|nr:type II secretion system-associated lipoprotein [bacterium]